MQKIFMVLVDNISDMIQRHKGRDRGPVSHVRRFMKMVALSKLIYKFNINLIKAYFGEVEEPFFLFIGGASLQIARRQVSAPV